MNLCWAFWEGDREMVKTVFVDVNILMSRKLQKDLKDNEVLCPVCGGLGLVKRTQDYGIRGVNHASGKMFPFKYENMQECHNCYNGIVTICKYCGQPNRDKNNIHAETNCQCKGASDARKAERVQKELETWQKAEKVPYSEALKRFEMLYIESYDRYIMADELEGWIEDNEISDIENLRIYGTQTTDISFDAGNLIESAVEDLHEDAGDNISGSDEKELQEMLDKWCEKISGTKTCWPDWKVGVLVVG
jgi:hypothetical protein